MELNKLTLAMLMAASVALTGCGSDDDDDNDPGQGQQVGGGDQGGSDGSAITADQLYINDGDQTIGSVCATVGVQSGVAIRTSAGTEASNFTPVCDLNGTVAENATLTTDYVYRLNGYVTVGNGNGELESDSTVANVTLTVNEGVQFRSSGRGSLVISRGSDIVANGTAENPIVMSSVDFGYDGSGEWGGLVLQGYAQNNQCGSSTPCNVADEAGTGFHGGTADDDNSGTLSYVIVTEGGFEVAPNSEVNGITLHSVGYGTTINNIMVNGNSDDGIEFFGGAANVKNLILVDNQDESIDWDHGYRGNIQFALIRQGVTAEGDHGIEADNDGSDFTNTPISNPTLANITFQENAAAGADDLFRFKEGTQGTLVNIAADGYQECIRTEDADTSVTFTNPLFECVAYEGGAFIDLRDGAVAGNFTNVPSASATVALGNAFEVTGGGASVSAVTPSSANGSAGFFMETNYIGAVDPTVTAAESAWWAWAEKVIPAAFK